MKLNPDNVVLAIVVFAFAVAGFGLTLATAAPSDPMCSEEGPRQRPSAADILEKDDANGNGAIEADEFPGPREHFDDFDTDGNGSLSQDEIEESLANRPHPRREGRSGERQRR